MDCRLVRERLDAYVDNELEPTPVIEFERHLDACPGCRNELGLWRLLRQAVRQQPLPAAPVGLRARVLDALDQADGNAATADRKRHRLFVGLVGAAAALALGVGAAVRGLPFEQEPVTAGASPAQLLRDIVAQHTDQLPTEIAPSRPEEVTQWYRGKLAFRVRPVEFAEPQVHMVGARVSYIGNQPAAKLYYRVGDNRVTMMVFPADAATLQLRQALNDEGEAQRLRLRRERIGNRVVAYDDVQNYTVPIFEHNGVVYALTGDLDKASLLRLAGSARLP